MPMLLCQTCVLQRGLTELYTMSSAVRWLHKCPHWRPQPLVLMPEIFQPNSWTSPWLEENTSPILKARSTPVTAAEVTMEKNSAVWASTAVNLSLQFIIRDKEECKRPGCFLGSHSGLPQPTTAAASVPLNCSLLFCWITLGASNQWVQLTYRDVFQLYIESQNHYTLKHGSSNLTLLGFSLLLLARPLYFLIHVRKLSQIVSWGKKTPMYIILCRMPKSPSLQWVMQYLGSSWEDWTCACSVGGSRISSQSISRWLGAEGISLVTPTGNSWQKPRVRDTASQVFQHNFATSGHLQGLHWAEMMAQGTWEATAPLQQ